jgi:hypothetical protein
MRTGLAVGTLVGILLLCSLPAAGQTDFPERLPAEMFSEDGPDPGLVASAAFGPPPDADPALHDFAVILTIELGLMDRDNVTALAGSGTFPGLSAEFFVHEGWLVPVESDIIQSSCCWDLILSPGRVWSDPNDGGWSRAGFPFVLINSSFPEAHNGLATFLYNEKTVSSVRIQVTAETAPEREFDARALLPATYQPGPVGADVREAFAAELAARLPVRHLAELSEEVGSDLESEIIGDIPPEEVSAVAVVVDGTIYQGRSTTRTGDHPYPGSIRSSVYSMSKSMAGGISALWLAQEYGPEVLDQRIADWLEVTADHNGWDDVTVRHCIDMAVGIGDKNPEPWPLDIMGEAGGDQRMPRFWNSRTAPAKLDIVFSYGDYAWGPGEIARYTDKHTFVFSAAAEAFLEGQGDPEADLWEEVTREVLEPIGLSGIPMSHTLPTPDGDTVAFLSTGLYPNVQESAKVALLLMDGGTFEEHQLLHPDLVQEALFRDGNFGGYSSGIANPAGDLAYRLSFWGLAYEARDGTLHQIPHMSGFGGNFLLLAPNNVAVLVYTDHGNTNLSGYSVAVRLAEVAEAVKPFPPGAMAPGPPLMGNRVVLAPQNQSLLWTLFWIAMAWLVTASASAVFLALQTRSRDGRAAWAAAGLVTGPLAVLGHARKTGAGPGTAFGDAALAVIGPFVGLVATTIGFGAIDLRAVVVGLVVGWLAVRVPLAWRRTPWASGRAMLALVPIEFISASWVWVGMLVVADSLGVAYFNRFGMEVPFGSVVSIMIGIAGALTGFVTAIPAQLWLGRYRLSSLTIGPHSSLPGWPARIIALMVTIAALAGTIALALST